MEICKSCEFNSDKARILHNYKSIRPDFHCSRCGCTLEAKTKCLSCACPETPAKWSAYLSVEEDQKLDAELKKEENNESA